MNDRKGTRRVGIPLLLSCLLCAVLTELPAATAPVTDGGAQGGYGGKWFSMGTVIERVPCSTAQYLYVQYPPPPHLELHNTNTWKQVYYLLEGCYYDPHASECMQGNARKSYQGGGC